MTQSEAYEATLARSSDAAVIRAKLFLSPTSASTPTTVISLDPVSLGGRLAAMAGIYSSYRIKVAILKFLTVPGGASVALGALDDASGAEGDAPTSISGVQELRCSGTSMQGVTVPTEFQWSPVDKTLWYKTFAGSSGSDQRLVIPAILYSCGASGTPSFSLEIDVTCVFKGAVDTVSL
jgi:hypothetical protein